jgi:hypothetical protein
MDTTFNYWLVGANWAGDNQAETFFLRGYWEMGYGDEDAPQQANLRDKIKIDDRIAVKSMNGKGATTITIRAIGVVKDIADKKVYVDWKLKDMNRIVASHGAFRTIQGPYLFKDQWTQEVFCL